MNASNRRWLPVIAIICASSVCLTGCKSFSWSQLPGMSYFAKDDKPAQSYYGTQNTPSSEYAASTVDYSQRYSNTEGEGAAVQNTYGQQYESTNVGNTNYLATQQPTQPNTGQQQSYGQQQPYNNQTVGYPTQAQQYQPQQNFNTAQPQNTATYQPQGNGQAVTKQNVPTAGALQDTAGSNYSGGGFYNPNANAGLYNGGTAMNTGQRNTYQPAGTVQNQPATGFQNTPTVPNYATDQNSGAAAYVSEAPNGNQFDGGAYVPAGNTTAPMPAYRPGSTGGTNGYYTPNGGNFNGQ